MNIPTLKMTAVPEKTGSKLYTPTEADTLFVNACKKCITPELLKMAEELRLSIRDSRGHPMLSIPAALEVIAAIGCLINTEKDGAPTLRKIKGQLTNTQGAADAFDNADEAE